MFQPKDICWLNRHKNRTHIYLSTIDTHQIQGHILTESEWKKIFHANGNQKKPRVALFIADKTDCKERYKRLKRTLHNDQGIIQKEDINQHRSTTICKVTVNSYKRRNQQ